MNDGTWAKSEALRENPRKSEMDYVSRHALAQPPLGQSHLCFAVP